jgi:hypothetical protein
MTQSLSGTRGTALADLAFTIAKLVYIGLAFTWLTTLFIVTITFSGLCNGITRCQRAHRRFSLRSLLRITSSTALILGIIGTIISASR